MKIHAIVLTAGKGDRLLPFTAEYHKSLFPILGESILHRLLSALIGSGVESITVGVGWLAEQIATHLKGLRFEKKIHVTHVENYEIGPLRTFVTTLQRCPASRLLVCPADLLADAEVITRFLKSESKTRALVNIAVDTAASTGTRIYGDDDGKVVSLTSSDTARYLGRSAMLLGVGMEFLDYALDSLQKGYTTVAQAIEHAISQGEEVRGVLIQGDWFDIDRPRSLLSCMKHLFDITTTTDGADIFLTRGDLFEVGQHIEFPSGTAIEKDVTLKGPLYIGKRCHISTGSRIGPYVDIEDDSRLGSDVRLTECLAFNNADVGDGTHLEQSIICGNETIRDRGN